MGKELAGEVHDVVGVGVGPFNLSLAALLARAPEVKAVFFERNAAFQWHPGLLLPDASLQVSFLKDLVTLADPTSPYSFLAYLASQKRLYRFIIADFPFALRSEFDAYLRWVAERLPSLRFGETVWSIDVDEDREVFLVKVGNHTVRARNLVLGTGLEPYVPPCAVPALGASVMHAIHFLKRRPDVTGKRVAVVGGGQSGAEIVHYLLGLPGLPEELLWISRRTNFLPLDESPFTNELFTPAYSDHFFGLSPERRAQLLVEQRLASDGIAPALLTAIYQRLYQLDLLRTGKRCYRLLPAHQLTGLAAAAHDWDLAIQDDDRAETQHLSADCVILATGFKSVLPSYLETMLPRIRRDGENLHVRSNFTISWDGPAQNRIFVQNRARHARGIADPNLSLMAWRSATIVNELAGRTVFDIEGAESAFEWDRRQ